MKTIILAAFLWLVPVAAMADWTWVDTAYQAAFLAATYAGYEQVNNALDKASKYDSYGMTERPSHGTVNTAFVTFAATHTAIAVILPSEYRRTWQAIGIGVGVGVNAYAIGLSVSLK